MASAASVPVSRVLSDLELQSLVRELGAQSAHLGADEQGHLNVHVHWAGPQAPASAAAKRNLAAAIAARLLPWPRTGPPSASSHALPPPAGLVEMLPSTFAALPEFAQIADEVDRQIELTMREQGADPYWLPSLLPRSVFSSSVLESVTLGGDISVSASDEAQPMRLTHAACMGFYPMFANRNLPGIEMGTSRVKCFRSEVEPRWPHLPEYSVREFIAVGPELAVLELAHRTSMVIQNLLRSWGLHLQECLANDSFLAADPAGAAYQAMSASKRELVHAGVALGSVNLHRSYFTRQWSITSGSQLAASCCLGVGLERATAALLQAHAQDVSRTWDALRTPAST